MAKRLAKWNAILLCASLHAGGAYLLFLNVQSKKQEKAIADIPSAHGDVITSQAPVIPKRLLRLFPSMDRLAFPSTAVCDFVVG